MLKCMRCVQFEHHCYQDWCDSAAIARALREISLVNKRLTRDVDCRPSSHVTVYEFTDILTDCGGIKMLNILSLLYRTHHWQQGVEVNWPVAEYLATLMHASKPWHSVGDGGWVMQARPLLAVSHIEHFMAWPAILQTKEYIQSLHKWANVTITHAN